MRIVYYRIVTVWRKYPRNDEIENRYVEFSYSKRRWKTIEGLTMDTDTTIKEKNAYLKEHLRHNCTAVKAGEYRI